MIAALDKRLPREITDEILSYYKAEYLAEIKSITVDYGYDGVGYNAFKSIEFKDQLMHEAYCETCGKKKWAEIPVHSRWESVQYAQQTHHSYCEGEGTLNIRVDEFRKWSRRFWRGKLE